MTLSPAGSPLRRVQSSIFQTSPMPYPLLYRSPLYHETHARTRTRRPEPLATRNLPLFCIHRGLARATARLSRPPRPRAPPPVSALPSGASSRPPPAPALGGSAAPARAPRTAARTLPRAPSKQLRLVPVRWRNHLVDWPLRPVPPSSARNPLRGGRTELPRASRLEQRAAAATAAHTLWKERPGLSRRSRAEEERNDPL